LEGARGDRRRRSGDRKGRRVARDGSGESGPVKKGEVAGTLGAGHEHNIALKLHRRCASSKPIRTPMASGFEGERARTTTFVRAAGGYGQWIRSRGMRGKCGCTSLPETVDCGIYFFPYSSYFVPKRWGYGGWV